MESSRWCGSDSGQTWQTLLKVQSSGSAFLVVHVVSRFSATRARAGGTVFPCCRVCPVTSCNACNRLHLLLRQSLTVFDRTVIYPWGFSPFEDTLSGRVATSGQSLVAGEEIRIPCASGRAPGVQPLGISKGVFPKLSRYQSHFHADIFVCRL